MRKKLLLVLQTVVTVGLLIWLFRDPEIHGNTRAVLQSADPLWLLAAIAVAGTENFLGVLRWRIFLRMLEIRIPFWQAVRLYFLGLFFNSFLVGSVGGDAVKALVLIGKGNRASASFLSVLLDRMSGLGALILVSCTFLLANYAWLTASPLAAGLIHFVFFYLGAVVLLLCFSFVAAWTGFADRSPRWIPFRDKLSQVCELYFLFVREWPRTLLAAGISVFMLLGYFFIFYCTMRAFGVEIALDRVFALMPAVDIIAALPISLGGVGVREKVLVILLGQLAEVPGAEAVWISIAGYLATLFWGVCGLLTLPFFKGLLDKGRDVAGPGPIDPTSKGFLPETSTSGEGDVRQREIN